MKRLLIIVFLFTSIFILFSETTVTVSGAENWMPYLYYNDNRPNGLSVDILNEIGKRTELEFQFKNYPFVRALDSVLNETVDLINAVYFTSERNKVYEYSISYSSDKVLVFALKDVEWQFSKLEDLSDLHGLIPFGGKYGDKFEKAKSFLNITEVNSDTNTILRMLSLRRADYLISAEYDVKQDLEEAGLINRFKIFSNPVDVNNVYFIAAKTDRGKYIISIINSALKEMKNDGSLDKIRASYNLD